MIIPSCSPFFILVSVTTVWRQSHMVPRMWSLTYCYSLTEFNVLSVFHLYLKKCGFYYVCGHMHYMRFKLWYYMFKVILFGAVSSAWQWNCQINQILFVFMLILGIVNLFILAYILMFTSLVCWYYKCLCLFSLRTLCLVS